jgi:hypothetical protein
MISRQIISWIDGVPTLVVQPMLTKALTTDIILAAASQPYHDPLGLEPEFLGMSNMEVMVIKQVRRAATTGERVDVEGILDRILGRPKTSAENTNVSVSYEDFLREVDSKESAKRQIIDVTPDPLTP